ncbi:MAG: glycosyltransferase, partial [Anaerolineae bacterium]
GGAPFVVDFVLGATMMLRREIVAQTGGFDEAFFMYCEEIDWAWRIHEAGWDVRCVPAARVTHLAGQSTAQVRPRSVVDLWTSRLLLVDKNYPAWKRPLARVLISTGMTYKLRGTGDPALREAYQTVRTLALGRR